MTISTKHIMEGNKLDRGGKSGWKFTRVYIHQGITSTGDQRLVDAANALLAATSIDIGYRHPIKTLSFVTGISHEPLSNEGKVKSIVVFEQLIPEDPANPGVELPQIELHATLTQEQTNLDYAGNPITVTYSGTEANSISTTQGGTVPKMVPVITKSVTVSRSGDPTSYARGRIGCLIAGTSQKELVTSIDASSKDGGLTYQYTETHTFKEANWNVDVYWTNPKTGKPASDASLSGVGGRVSKCLYVEI